MSGNVDGREIILGNAKLMRDRGIPIEDLTSDWERLANEGKTPMYVAIDGKPAGLVLPSCNTQAMSLHLAEIATEVTPGSHAVVLLDQVGWRLALQLVVPSNITIVPLPPKCPELNPVENVWQFMRDN